MVTAFFPRLPVGVVDFVIPSSRYFIGLAPEGVNPSLLLSLIQPQDTRRSPGSPRVMPWCLRGQPAPEV